MYRYLLIAMALLGYARAEAQNLDTEIAYCRQKYKEEFLTEPHSPLSAADTGFLRFYGVDVAYTAMATIELTPDAPTFDMQTHGTKTQQYKQYGLLRFSIKGKACSLAMYQNVQMMDGAFLFLPFNDLTNGKTTFGGGRYLDIRKEAIYKGTVFLDFNKCYNPYCAYKSGYSCPIPPSENRLNIKIEAGEKQFGKKIAE